MIINYFGQYIYQHWSTDCICLLLKFFSFSFSIRIYLAGKNLQRVGRAVVAILSKTPGQLLVDHRDKKKLQRHRFKPLDATSLPSWFLPRNNFQYSLQIIIHILNLVNDTKAIEYQVADLISIKERCAISELQYRERRRLCSLNISNFGLLHSPKEENCTVNQPRPPVPSQIRYCFLVCSSLEWETILFHGNRLCRIRLPSLTL